MSVWLRRGRVGAAARSPRVRFCSFSRWLRFEPLEDRRLLSITVDTLVDEADGSIVDGDISLRDAIASAVSGDTIDFAAALTAGGPATLTLTLDELFVLNKSLTIAGPGADRLTIDASGNDPTPDENNGDGSRVLRLKNNVSSTTIQAHVSGLTITGGDIDGIASAGMGGGILNVFVMGPNAGYCDLTVTDCVIVGNSATLGGGIYSTQGDLTLTGSTVKNNSAVGRGGGIIGNTISVVESTISGNVAGEAGGGIHAYYALDVLESTISGNHAVAADGGGILLGQGNGANAVITSTTISGNSAEGNGGGIAFWPSPAGPTDLQIVHSTISGNQSDAGNDGGGLGGGVFWYDNPLPIDVPVVLDHSILAGNLRGPATRDDFSGDLILNYSLIGDSSGATILSNVNSLIGTSAVPIDPLLGPLEYNGGPTNTHSLLPGSPAIDAGDADAVAGMGDVPEFDQRGAPLTRVYDGDGDLTPRIDIGAVERQPTPPAIFGDYNENGFVDAADYTVWRNASGQTGLPLYDGADGNGDGNITFDDYLVWKEHYGQVIPGAGARTEFKASTEPAQALITRSTAAPTADGALAEIVLADFGELSRVASVGHLAKSLIAGDDVAQPNLLRWIGVFRSSQPDRSELASGEARLRGLHRTTFLARDAALLELFDLPRMNGITRENHIGPVTSFDDSRFEWNDALSAAIDSAMDRPLALLL